MAQAKMPYKDQMPGGVGDEKAPLDFDQEQLKKGVLVELEHADDPAVALEIAIDHLTEDPHYYDMLEKLEPQHDPSKPDEDDDDGEDGEDEGEEKPVKRKEKDARTFIEGDDFVEMLSDLVLSLYKRGDDALAEEVEAAIINWR